MLIQCPSCQARAKIPDSSEGAKVRCECGRVYVARASGSKGSTRGPNTGLLIGGFVGAVGLIVVVFIARGADDAAPVAKAAPEAAPAPPPALEFGWNSELVMGVVALHEAAHAGERERLKGLLHSGRVWAREHTIEGVLDASVPAFEALPPHERVDVQDRWVNELCAGADKALVADWLPYDGLVVEQEDDEALVRVAVRPRDGGIENRWIEWRLAKEGGRYKAWSWARWISPDEEKLAKRKKGYEVVTLSDGSIVHERPPEPLPHLADTPPELQTRIDTLVATMLDLELTKEGARAKRELVEIGRPAVPILLTRFFETPADTEENRIRCNLIDQALQSITGQHFGYAPGEAGTAAGTSEERRQSSIKQWFAWWHKNQRKFTEKQTSDGLEGLIELTEEEKRWLERNQDD